MRSWVCSLTVLAASLKGASALGAPQTHYDLKHTEWTYLGSETLLAASVLGGTWLFTGGPRNQCRWCESNAFDESVRSSLRAREPRDPAFVSHALSFVAIPVLSFSGLVIPAFQDQKRQRALEDSWLVVNSFALTTAIGVLTKQVAARERPAFHHDVESQMEFSDWPAERNQSFFSVDTAWAFAIASSATTVAHLRGYASRDYIAVGGGLLALSTGTLRIVGDAHWASDVLVGALVGTSVGIAVPALLHGRRAENTATAPQPLSQGSVVTLGLAF